MHPYIRPVYTGRTRRPYTPINVLFKTFIYDVTSQRAAENAIWFLIGCLDFCTARIYGCSIRTTRIYGPYSQKALQEMLFLYGPYIRAVCTGARYAPPVYTARMYGPYIRVSKTHPYIRAVYTARVYGPYIRLVRNGLKNGLLT